MTLNTLQIKVTNDNIYHNIHIPTDLEFPDGVLMLHPVENLEEVYCNGAE